MRKNAVIIVCIIVTMGLAACGRSKDTDNDIIRIQAEYPVYDTAQGLVDEADLVFSGKVKKVSYQMLDTRTESGTDSMTGLSKSTDIPYTIYEISVEKVYKGDSTEKVISIKCPGGKCDGTTYIVDGAMQIEKGGQYLFLTKTYENTYPSLLNITQASYDMNAPEVMSESDDNAITLSQLLEILE